MGDRRWVDYFLSKKSSKLYVRIDEEFICNSFNLFGIRKRVDNFTDACNVIRRNVSDLDAYGSRRDAIEKDAEKVYGLLHARFLLTRNGWDLMLQKYNQKDLFPKCPRVFCRNCPCLPYGVSEEPGREKVKMFCPNCYDIYNIDDPDITDIEGAYFGPSWIHMFLQKYPDLIQREPAVRVYVPRICGFKIYHPDGSEEEDEYDSDDE